MALKDVQVILKHVNGMPRDTYVNTLHFEVNFPDTVEGMCDDINAAYFAMNGSFANYVEGMTIKVYPPGLNFAGPEFSKHYTNITGGSGSAPAEVSCCLSYATVDDPAASTPRRRGRIYVGPFGSAATLERPGLTVGLGPIVRQLGVALSQVGTAGNTTWMMRSVADNAYFKIESIWTDDAWDTQRRRGAAATARITIDVQ